MSEARDNRHATQRDHARSIAVSLENELAEQAHQHDTWARVNHSADLWITAADYEDGWHD